MKAKLELTRDQMDLIYGLLDREMHRGCQDELLEYVSPLQDKIYDAYLRAFHKEPPRYMYDKIKGL